MRMQESGFFFLLLFKKKKYLNNFVEKLALINTKECDVLARLCVGD